MLVVLLNHWEVALLVAELLVIRHEVERIVEHLSEDLVLAKEGVESLAIFNLNDVEVVCVIDISSLVWGLDAWDVLERLIVLAYQLTANLHILACTLHLAGAEGCLNVGDAIVVAEFLHLVVPQAILTLEFVGIVGDAMGAIESHLLIEILILGACHTALTCGDVLNGMEREYCNVGILAATGIDLLALRIGEVSTRSVTRVLKNPHAVLISHLAILLHVVRIARKVNEHHTLVGSLWRGCKGLLELVDVEQISLRIDVHKLDVTATEADAVGRRGKGHWGADDVIALLHTKSHGCNVKCCSGVADSNGIFGIDVFCKDLFEFGDGRSAGQVIPFEGIYHGLNIFVRNVLTTV